MADSSCSKKCYSKKYCTIGTVIIVTLITMLLSILIGLLLANYIIDINFIETGACEKSAFFEYCITDSSWNSDTYLDTITGFYGTIITLLITILGLFAFFSYIQIKASALSKIEEDITIEVERYFDSIPSGKKIAEAIEGSSSLLKAKSRMDVVEGILEENGLWQYGDLEVDNEEET